MRSTLRFLSALLLAAVLAPSQAQTYPSRPVKLIVPYAVGQGTDIAARFLADELGKELKQSFVVDNRPGAGGNVGTQAAARATPDGYTIMIGTNATHAANAFMYASPGYDAVADFEPIGMVGILPLVYVTNTGSAINSMQDLVRAARAKPDGLNVAVSTTTVLNNQVKALGVTSAKSSKLLPGVKSLAEQGIPGYELVGWTVFYAPKGIPPDALTPAAPGAARSAPAPAPAPCHPAHCAR